MSSRRISRAGARSICANRRSFSRSRTGFARASGQGTPMTTEASALARPPGAVWTLARGNILPVGVVVLVVLVVWYVATVPMNWVVSQPKIDAAGGGLGN